MRRPFSIGRAAKKAARPLGKAAPFCPACQPLGKRTGKAGLKSAAGMDGQETMVMQDHNEPVATNTSAAPSADCAT
jgi:hypothetical protein